MPLDLESQVNWISISAWLLLSAAALLLLAFALTSLAEREWRASALSAALGMAVLGGLTCLLVFELEGKRWLLLGLLAVGGLSVLDLLVPTGRGRSGLGVVGVRPRIDERDAVFHRFYRLEPGSPEYEEYYRRQPALRSFDEKLRAKPDLGKPDSRHYHPLSSAYLHAVFGVTAELAAGADEPDAALEGRAIALSPPEASRRLKGLAEHLGADRVGCARLDPADVYSHIGRGPGRWGEAIAVEHTHALVVGVEMGWELLRQAPRTATTTETAVAYYRSAQVVCALARVIQRWGYRARPHLDGNYRVLCVPIAERAGLGETGRHGLLIAPRCGPRIRLAVVTTDLELATDGPTALGVQDFCTFCKKCASNCPSGAVDAEDKAVYAGVEKWQTDRDRCYRMWRQLGTDCGLCLKVCPFAKPASFVHQLVRWAVVRNASARRLALWADDFFYGRRPSARPALPAWHREDAADSRLNEPSPFRGAARRSISADFVRRPDPPDGPA